MKKTNNTFGTLFIQLPSIYEGGLLTVFHNKQKTEFSFGGPDACGNIYYAAFYSDCKYEVQPITKGHCLFLVYSLLYTEVEQCPVPPDNRRQVFRIISAMKQWDKDVGSSHCPEIMSYMLKHQYCKVNRGLSFRVLQNTDSTVADVLLQAKALVDFNVYVSNVHFTELYNAHSSDDYSDGLFCEELEGKHLRTHDGDRVSYRVLFSPNSLVPHGFFSGIAPDSEKFEKETGEEDGTLIKRYHWAALLLWPVKRNPAVIGLHKMIDLFRIEAMKNRKNIYLITVAKDIFGELRCDPFMIHCILRFLQALLVFDNKEFIIECLNIIPESSCCCYCTSNDDFPMVVSIIGCKYGWDILKSPLMAIFKKCTPSQVEKHCQFLKTITFKQLSDDQRDVCQSLAAVFVDFLANEKDPTPVSHSSYSQDEEIVERSKEFVQNLAITLTTLDRDDLLFSFVDLMRSNHHRYPELDALGPVGLKLISRDHSGREPSAKKRKVGNDMSFASDTSSNDASSI